MNLHRDVVWFEGIEIGLSITTTYHQNANSEGFNMFHWMTSQLLHQRKASGEGKHWYILS